MLISFSYKVTKIQSSVSIYSSFPHALNWTIASLLFVLRTGIENFDNVLTEKLYARENLLISVFGRSFAQYVVGEYEINFQSDFENLKSFQHRFGNL